MLKSTGIEKDLGVVSDFDTDRKILSARTDEEHQEETVKNKVYGNQL